MAIDNDSESDSLGRLIARACAGYFHRRLLDIAARAGKVRVGVAWGWMTRQVLNELRDMHVAGLLQPPDPLLDCVVWCPVIGNLAVPHYNYEASAIASGFREFYGGGFVGFSAVGLLSPDTTLSALPRSDLDLIESLRGADLILVAAAPWNEEPRLLSAPAGSRLDLFPPLGAAVGEMSLVFFDDQGNEVPRPCSVAGLDYEGFKTGARRGAVIVMCGSDKRRQVALALLRGGLASVVVTTTPTAEHVLRELESTGLST